MYYSRSTNGFYSPDINGKNMPADVTHESEWQYTHAELLAGQSSVKIIAPDENGYPVLKPRPELSAEYVQEAVNAEARALLLATDWYVIRQLDTGQAIPVEIAEKRAKAREAVKP